MLVIVKLSGQKKLKSLEECLFGENMLIKAGQQASLWGIFLEGDWCGKTNPIRVGAMPG